jgi:hypothetical protein
MKPQRLLVTLVFLAVCLLAANAYVLRSSRLPAPQQSNLETSAPQGQHSSSPTENPSISTTGPVSSFSWREVESADFHKFIANLRAIGCPEQTIRDVILAEVNKQFAPREKPLKTGPKPTKGNPGETAEQRVERLRQLRALQLEKRSLVKDLLGIDTPLDVLPSSGSRDYHAFEVAFNFLPSDKRDAVQLLQEKYWQDSDALSAKYGSTRSPQFAADSRQLKDSLRQDLAKLLTPAELEDYDLRTSPTAQQLSANLSTYFHPTEDEFRQIYRAQTAYETAVANLAATTAANAQPVDPADPAAVAQQRAAQRQALNDARSAARTQMNDQIKTALGDDRYTDYQRSQDRTYDMLARLGTRYGLPQETVMQAYDLQKSFGSGNTPQMQAADRADLQKQLNDQLTTILGDQPARAYRRAHQGGTVPLN